MPVSTVNFCCCPNEFNSVLYAVQLCKMFSDSSCGNTAIQVACGREKKTKPPKCQLQCKIRSRCHHTNEHKCHMGECPPCNEPCFLENDTTNCVHPCIARCHDSVKVLVSDKSFKPAGPWDVQVEKYEIMKLPHPKCEIKIPVECIGGHEIAPWPCWESKPNSCGRMCGRALSCGNHKCEKMCHTVDDKTSMMVRIVLPYTQILEFETNSNNKLYTIFYFEKLYHCSKINHVKNVWKCAVYRDWHPVVFINVRENVIQNHANHVQLLLKSLAIVD